MKLVIAEKKDVALLIARALGGAGRTGRLPAYAGDYVITAAQGHLLELVPPEAYDARLAYAGGAWDLEDLPIIFDNWKREIKREVDESGRKTRTPSKFASGRVEQIAALARECDGIVNAGDPDDEGQLLVDEIIEHIGWKGPVERVYINDNIERNVAREFGRLKDNAECKPDGAAAYARAMADFVFGINETRLAARKLGLRNTSVGRVQTPTLALIVARDLAIERFQEREYFEVEAKVEGSWGAAAFKFEPSEAVLEEHAFDGRHILDEKVMRGIADVLVRQRTVVVDVDRKTESRAAPLPYNITQLQADMNKRFGYPSAKTLAITQALRDKYHAITYNRTSSSYLKEEHHQEAPRVLGLAMENIGASWPLDFSIHSKAFDDAKVTAHHGIIPQEQRVTLNEMTADERNVYCAIVRRYAMQFLPAAVYDVCSAAAEAANGRLVYRSKELVSPGWTGYAERKPAGETGKPLLPAGKHRGEITAAELVSKMTTPPKRYTEATLLADMTHAAKFVRDPKLKEVMRKKDASTPEESGAIGTSATRHVIIETLKKRGFIEARGKGAIVSTERGRAFISVLPADLKKIDTTARWWLIQEDIRAGKESVNKLPRAVAANFERHKESAYANVAVPRALQADNARRTLQAPCPRCGKPVVEGKNSLQCSTNKFSKEDGGWKLAAGCGWSFGKVLARKKLTASQCERLLAGNRVLVRGMTSRKGSKFDAYVRLSDPDSGKVEFSFDGIASKAPGRR